ncbi:hypothetical protein ES703_12546 [subsurface metagenome]
MTIILSKSQKNSFNNYERRRNEKSIIMVSGSGDKHVDDSCFLTQWL